MSGTWTTKDGRVLKIAEMTDEHLRNTMRYLDRAKITEAYKLDCAAETMDGEMAQMALEQAAYETAWGPTEDTYPVYAEMRAELQRRGVDGPTPCKAGEKP